ncbi:hypothetical protein KP509_20G046000 [Ceratopteris richardii]|uniref:DEK-C domain-containing protein n=2 Tax=Ceratopteris richardii TaxID=49495 RepID=A0A8T2SGQ3_CERRI|nr:hypothetical protein KP509_20G046000 [Ceratopteris richardii]KAH7331669.1 hypothetical protein KP509_20G046000 [Ceratopteris richardii]KAH7331670.1 hypothetical protein KP509_20G046000 [Ceratopteris richardii]KAH7331671.1 hypothetical protein KP509_20G046000 [Ceratopteris richardii]KAH7331672.1 hypothetical protein KP509_20G046000 [Ceratopteris richardii]
MEGEGVETQQNVNHKDTVKDDSDVEMAEVGEAKAGKKRKSRESLSSPTTDRPTRERKSVERLIFTPDKEIKEFKILKGSGSTLKEIPNVVYKLSKHKSSDEAVQMLHRIMFGKVGAKHTGKANILQFSGFVWGENKEKERAKVKERLEKVVKETLFQMGDILDLNLQKSLKKEDTVVKVLEFLESPHKTTDVLIEEKIKSKKVKKTKKTPKRGKKGQTPVKKSPKVQKRTPKKKQSSDEEDGATSPDEVEDTEEVEEEEDQDEDYNEKASQKTKRKRVSTKEKPVPETEGEEEEPSPKKNKMQKKKEPTQKVAKGKKPKVKAEAKAKAKKTKDPGDEELRGAICELLKSADFSKVTFTDVMKQLGEKFNADLTHMKSHLKVLIQEEIARLVGEGDNEDEDSNSEGDVEDKANKAKDEEDMSPDNGGAEGDGPDVKDDEEDEKSDGTEEEKKVTTTDEKEDSAEDEDAQVEGDDDEAKGA